MKVLVTGGCGFIGSALIRLLIEESDHIVLNLDKLSYASNPSALDSVSMSPRYNFIQADCADLASMKQIIHQFRPQWIFHLAAETHVDRSIDSASEFINSNILGTYSLLEGTRAYLSTLSSNDKNLFKLIHVSTDEVFGSLGATDYFHEDSPYKPNSPYAATKASADHLVRAWSHTYNIPINCTNCSNNYGPWQFPEKLIPLMISKLLLKEPLPIYGNGQNIRDWLYVEDHARALLSVAEHGANGESYNIGANCEKSNLDLVSELCTHFDDITESGQDSYKSLVKFVGDRPGHDQRYAIDSSKIQRELNWKPQEKFSTSLRMTVQWYLNNQSWLLGIAAQKYQGERLGLQTRAEAPPVREALASEPTSL